MRQIDRADLVEHEDYEVFVVDYENPLGGRPAKEFALSPNAAKEIAMMSSSDKGKLIRNYFLDCELKLKSQVPAIPTDYEEALEQLLKTVKERKQLQLENQRQQQLIQEKTEHVNVMKETLSNRHFDKLLNSSDLSRELSANPVWSVIEGNRRWNWNPSSHDIMNYLRDRDLIFKNGSKVKQNLTDRYGDVVVIEEFTLRKTQQTRFNVKFNVHSEGFVLFIKEMKNFMIENKIGLAKSGYLPGIEW